MEPPLQNSSYFSLTEDVLRDSLADSAIAVRQLDISMPYLGNKLRSEIFSKTLEVKLAEKLSDKLGYEVTSPKSDNDPDLYYSRLPEGYNAVEIKCASGETWRGGTYSKRAAPTLFVTWEGENWNSFYVGFLFIRHEEWTTASANYYAPTISKKFLRDRQDREDIIGNITFGFSSSGKENRNQTKINYEEVSDP